MPGHTHSTACEGRDGDYICGQTERAGSNEIVKDATPRAPQKQHRRETRPGRNSADRKGTSK